MSGVALSERILEAYDELRSTEALRSDVLAQAIQSVRGAVETIIVDGPKYLAGSWSLGVGFETKVLKDSAIVAPMLYEPYIVIDEGRLQTVDGQSELSAPIRVAF